MSSSTRVTYGKRAIVSLGVVAAALTVLAVLLEMSWGLPVKMPGHRALPGALALLVVAEVAAPWLILAYSVLTPLVIVWLDRGGLELLVPWVGLALLLVALKDARFRRRGWALVVAGLVYGALRYGVLLGPHKTPQIVRA
ncbi:MAG: hypothetical protein IT373_06645, partial [Polyangiaceae bacterium]|nr:hypothetical protein [Polyangiaceae bacterium]